MNIENKNLWGPGVSNFLPDQSIYFILDDWIIGHLYIIITGFRIRIFFADPDPDLGKNLHADPDPDPDPGGIRGRGLGVKSFFHVSDDS